MNKRIPWRLLLYSGVFSSVFATIWIFYDILNYGEFCAIEPSLSILALEFTFFASLLIVFPIYAYFNIKKEINREVRKLFKNNEGKR